MTKQETTTQPPELGSGETRAERVYSERVLKSDSIVKSYMIASMGLGMVPIPLFDLAALMATQVKMVHSLTQHYKVPFKSEGIKSMLASLMSGALGVGAMIGLASLAKIFPMVGTLLGGVTASILSGALTYAVGSVFTRHFEQGGTLLNFNAKRMRAHFKRELKSGKEAAQNLKNSESATDSTV